MRRTQTSEDRQNRPAQSGDGEGADALRPALHEVYDPDIEWRMEEARHVIMLKVEGFKKEQLRVQANTNPEEVTVTGERPLDGGRSVRFRKTFKLDIGLYKMDAIRSKLWNSVLNIILPLKEPQLSSQPPTGEEPKAMIDGNRGPKSDVTASGGSSLGLAIQKKRAWRVLAGAVIAVAAIGVGAFLIYRYFMI